MNATGSRPLVLLLLLLLTAAAALPTTADTQALQCPNVHDITKNEPVFLSLDEQGARSVRFSLPMESDWEVVFTLGEGTAESFTPRTHLEIKKNKPKAQLAQIKVTTVEGKKTMLLNSRVDSSWLEGDGQARLFLGEETLSIAFVNGDSKFLQQLSDPQLVGLNTVQVNGALQVEECEGPGRVPDTVATTTAATTTAVPTTTTAATTTAVPTTTTATTSEPATTTDTSTVADTSTITPTSEESTVLTTEDTYNTTTSEDDLPPPCMTADEVAAACPTPSNDSVAAVAPVGGSVQCVAVPRWAWACAGLAVVFFMFIVGLIVYSVTLYKRSWRNEKALQASGGFGMTAQDMHYYEMRNNNLMIGNTVPRIVTPRPSSIPGLTPSHSTSRLSHSLSPSRTSTPFPLPLQSTDQMDSMNNITDHREKSRSSKVSFAED